MTAENISVIKVRNMLMVTVPPEPDDETITTLQDEVLSAMQKHDVIGLVLDISTVETLDSFFARTVVETSQMVDLMGGRTVVAGMRPAVAITAPQLGLTFGKIRTSLDVERALDILSESQDREGRHGTPIAR
jgi:rsbT antagonist protein RsbS